MTGRTRLILLALAALAPPVTAQDAGAGYTRNFPIAACDFKANGGNAFLRLQPGRQLHLSNQRCVDDGNCDELEELWITMLRETRVIDFPFGGQTRSARTRVMEEYETVDGEVEEISRNYVADCNPMHDVYYFGEDVEDGGGNPLDDAWLAGVDGARPGILMPDRAFLLGSRYYQEIAPNARDRAEHTSMNLVVEVPAGTFRGCIEVTETTPLEPDSESLKTYCPGIGMVRDDDLELVEVTNNATSPSAQR